MISRQLANKLFDSFSIYRWTDRIRPVELVLIDKHAHKAILTFFIATMEEENGQKVDWIYIINGIVFSMLKSIVLSDIKACVLNRIESQYPEQNKDLNKWVVKQYEPFIDNPVFISEFNAFLADEPINHKLEASILKAANKYSTLREFEIIKSANESFSGIREIERKLNEEIENLPSFTAISQLTAKTKLFDALCIIEQLRYQIRWSRTPRIPKTSVLGHSMYVALLSFFISRDLNVCNQRLVNNFYAALFHDIPESVTRDIISPVKHAITDLPDLIRKVESEFCEEELYPKFPECIRNRIKYLIGDMPEISDEFTNRIYKGGIVTDLDDKPLSPDYDKDEYDPVDGKLIKVCDNLAAYMEAAMSEEYGITTKNLQKSAADLRKLYENEPIIQGVDVNKFFGGLV